MLPLAAALAAAGHRVTALALSGRRNPPYEGMADQTGVAVRTVGPSLRATETNSPPVWTTVSRFLHGHWALRKALARTTADAVILAKPQVQNTGPAIQYARVTGVPLIVDTDDIEAYASRLPGPLRLYAAALERRAVRSAQLVTACSPFLAERAKRQNTLARVEFLPTGIHVPSHIPKRALRENLGLSPCARILLYVGSLSRPSGHRVDILLDAFHRVLETRPSDTERHGPDIHLALAGDGIDLDLLRAHARSLPLIAGRVHFLGAFTPPEDIALAREADLLVDPVDTRMVNEAKSSHRMMLALVTGTPIVAGNVGIRPHLLPPDLHADCLYDPSSLTDFVRALTRALTPEFREEFRRGVSEGSDRWLWSTMGPAFVRLVEETVRAWTEQRRDHAPAR